MARVCEICGKGRGLGNRVETRGKAKYLGGVGTKVTGITRRAFLPNLQNVRTTSPNGTSKTVRACTQCIRSGAIRKHVQNAPFKLSHDAETTLGRIPVRKGSNTKASGTKETGKSAAPKRTGAKNASPQAAAKSPAKK